MFLVKVFVEDLIKVFIEFHQKVKVLNEDLKQVFNEDLFYGTALSLLSTSFLTLLCAFAASLFMFVRRGNCTHVLGLCTCV